MFQHVQIIALLLCSSTRSCLGDDTNTTAAKRLAHVDYAPVDETGTSWTVDNPDNNKTNFNTTNISSVKHSTGDYVHVDTVEGFLRLVEKYKSNKENCSVGTSYNLGDGVVQQYGKRRFKSEALLAVNRANLLTEIWKLDNDILHDDEGFFFSQVMNLVESDDDIFAAGNCYELNEFKDYKQFCPYAFRIDGGPSTMVKDLSLEYEYLGEKVEWFHQARMKARMLLETRNKTFNYRIMRTDQWGLPNDDEYVINDTHVAVEYEDGHWSRPYYDCGGGYIWMMTYTVPFFGLENGTFQFKGTSGIDIDLQKVDINQCAEAPDATEQNVFANTSKCDERTTECTPVGGIGFRRGSYKCVCKQGYYFGDTNLVREQRYFNGVHVEEEYDKLMKGLPNHYNSLHCLKCAPGCDECVDNRPCILTLNWVLRTCLLVASCIIMCFIPALAFFIWWHRHLKVLRAASPKLLCLILVGAVFLYCPMIVMYFDATELICTLKVWLRELGFSISYGALLLKTWRISVVFRVRSATRIKITDTGLIKRLGLLVAIFVIFLIVRTIWGRPQAVLGWHNNGLKANQCSFDVWDYCQAGAELCLLIWGIRLCIVVRKAPSEFNESRFISWAIYNETLLSIFLNLSLLFLQSPVNPDLLYIVYFIHTNLTTTVTLVFLFISKAYVIFKLMNNPRKAVGNSKGSSFKYTKKSTNGTNVSSGDSGISDTFIDERSGLLKKDVEDELKKVYTELECLKQNHMRLGNPHIKNGHNNLLTECSDQGTQTENYKDENGLYAKNNNNATKSSPHNILVTKKRPAPTMVFLHKRGIVHLDELTQATAV